jgi:hypothetical protein
MALITDLHVLIQFLPFILSQSSMLDQPIPKQTIFFQDVLGISLLQSREISSTNIFWCHCRGEKSQSYLSLGVRQSIVLFLDGEQELDTEFDCRSFT